MECDWNIYNDDEKVILGIWLYVSGLVSTILCCVLLTAILKSELLRKLSYLMHLNICLASLARCFFGFIFTGTSALFGRWIFGHWFCFMFGFISQLIMVYQIEAINHVCIERYVVAKYIKHGWDIPASRYTLYIALCLMFSLAYSFPQFLGIGEYSLDYTCSACTFSNVLPPNYWDRYAVVIVKMLQNVKPIFMVTSMLHWARQKDYNFTEKQNAVYNPNLTEVAANVTISSYICWAPSFILSSMVILPQIFDDVLIQPSPILVTVALLGSELAPAVVSLTLIFSDKNIYDAASKLLPSSTHFKYS